METILNTGNIHFCAEAKNIMTDQNIEAFNLVDVRQPSEY